MRCPSLWLVVIAVIATSPVSPVRAGPTGDVMTLDVLPGWRTDRGTQMAGLRFTLAPGWKTYWRTPGSAGIAPQFDWSGSRNLQSAVIDWPVPEIHRSAGVTTLVYSGQVVLPVEITPMAEGEEIRLAGTVDLGVCEDICVPLTIPFSAVLTDDSRIDPAIAAALAARPLTAQEAGVTATGCDAAATGEGLSLTVSLDIPDDGGQQVVVIEPGVEGVWVSDARTERRDGLLSATVDVIAADGGPLAVDRSNLRITVVDATRAVEIRGCSTG
jgi:DsbC/DsbD-like thiol-disulfide interchange protein